MAIHHLLSYSFLLLAFFFLSCLPSLHSLSTVSISHASNQTLICALIHSSDQHSYLNCTSFPHGIQIPLTSGNTSFSGIVGGNGFLCALSFPSSPSYMVCWRFSSNGTDMSYKRIYLGPPALKELDAGNSHVCGLADGTNKLECWQWPDLHLNGTKFVSSVAVGDGFVCGLLELGQIRCLGSYGNVIDHVPRGDYSLVASGSRHACATSSLNGSLECWGDMVGEKPAGEFKALALGETRSCAMRPNGTVTCWGEDGFALPGNIRDAFFVAIEGKGNVFCGVLASDLSLNCWGNEILDSNSNSSVMKNVMPGSCRSECPCGALPNYGTFCDQGLMICEPCKSPPLVIYSPSIPSQPPTSPPSRRTRWNKKMTAFLVVGCVGSLSFLIACGFLFSRYCKVRGYRVHDSGPLDDPLPPPRQGGPSQTSQVEQAIPTLEKRLSQLASLGNGGHLEEFSLQVLLRATSNFSEERKIGSGSFGSVYHGTLDDGREVAIKRAEVSSSSSYAGGTKRQEDQGHAFVNELEFLSRLNHKNLVGLLGYCEDFNELVLVYEYMNNGSLHDHLHKLQSSPLMSWAARIQVALDSARGIEYLHVYAVPPVIHRDVKSSNILLDANWTAKVSDFGLSLLGPPDDASHLSLLAAGTVGYMDPEYYRLQILTTKSDVYSFGVVLLELLSGYRAIHRNEDGVPRNVVDFVVPYIVQDEIHRVLDSNMPPPTPFEIEAVAYVGYLATDCVTLEGKDRPTMSEIVNSLEKALAACLATPTFSRSSTRSSS